MLFSKSWGLLLHRPSVWYNNEFIILNRCSIRFELIVFSSHDDDERSSVPAEIEQFGNMTTESCLV